MISSAVEIRDSRETGKGLFAKERIYKGDIVTQLDNTARRLTPDEVLELPRELQLHVYQEWDHFVLTTDGSEYTNHSCDPNIWWSNDETFVARRDIQPGEEITCDYSTFEISKPPIPDSNLCLCGSDNCRGVVTSSDCLDPEFQIRYKGHLPSWTMAFIESHNQSLHEILEV